MHRTIMTQGVPESYLAAMIRDWEEALPECVKLAYLPRPGIVRLRLSVYGECAEDAKNILQVNIDKLLKIISEHVFGYDDVSLEESLGSLLREKGLHVATAESCTGGNVARLIASVPGASDYFSGSVVAYRNEMKTAALRVDPVILEKEGAVSRAVVEQMAAGIRALTGAETAIAISGIAGPSGGTPEKPVGTVWIAVSHLQNIHAVRLNFGGNRERIIEQATHAALQLLRRLILGNL
ncbi:MAG: nicotinamide-nucleotide amidohydrolase family protein [Bacteroidales bacterium]